MSILIMSQVWKHGPDDQGMLLVLLALADHADDNGVCWPSMMTIGDKARMSERNARRVVKRLEEDGYLTISRSTGRSANRYVVHPDGNPDKLSGSDNQPGQMKHPTRTNAPSNPDTAMSGKSSRTIKNRHARSREFSSLSDFWADCIRRNTPGVSSHVSPTKARELIQAKIVTEEECRKAGVL